MTYHIHTIESLGFQNSVKCMHCLPNLLFDLVCQCYLLFLFFLIKVLPAILFVKATMKSRVRIPGLRDWLWWTILQGRRKRRWKHWFLRLYKLYTLESFPYSRGSLDRYSLVSFVTSLLFLIQPIQVYIVIKVQLLRNCQADLITLEFILGESCVLLWTLP